MGKALIVMRSVALFFALYSFLFSQSDPDPQRHFYSKTGKELFIEQFIDWDLRYKYMKMHTSLHLLSVVIPLPVTGGQIGANKSRLDFDMPEAVEDKLIIENKINELIKSDLIVDQTWITEEELDKKT